MCVLKRIVLSNYTSCQELPLSISLSHRENWFMSVWEEEWAGLAHVVLCVFFLLFLLAPPAIYSGCSEVPSQAG